LYQLSTLFLLRILSIALAFSVNVAILKSLDLKEMGAYYVMATVAYFGNAIFFVGLDFSFQKKIQKISVIKTIDYLELNRYITKTYPLGVLATLSLSIAISLLSNNIHWLSISLACALLCGFTYLTTFFRNILLIAGDKIGVSLSYFFEQASKLGLVIGFILYGLNSAVEIILVLSLSAFITAVYGFIRVKIYLKNSNKIQVYSNTGADYKKIIIPTGISGVLNWAQLQGYRPIIGGFLGKPEVVGSVGFLTMLGGAITSAVFSVMAQYWVPRQFSSGGVDTKIILKKTMYAIIALALMAYPTTFIFIRAISIEQFNGMEYLVSVGVIVEGCNYIIGLLGSHSNITNGSYLKSAISSICGLVVITFILIMFNTSNMIDPLTVGLSLALSQIVSVIILFYLVFKK